MRRERDNQRRDYWNTKHRDPQWEEDIHIALFSDRQVDSPGFKRGVRLNTEELISDIAQLATRGDGGICSVLDFGCGAGDFLIELARTRPQIRCMGLDIADSAIDRASNRAQSAGVKNRIHWKVGDVSALSQIGERTNSFDVIVCRDMYYLLDRLEQELFWSACRQLLSFQGLLYVADLAIRSDSFSRIVTCLVDRQYGGDPISWRIEASTGLRRFSIEEQAAQHGFCFRDPPREDESAIANSYFVAALLVSDPNVKESFEQIAAIASINERGWSVLPYVRFNFRRKLEEKRPES